MRGNAPSPHGIMGDSGGPESRTAVPSIDAPKAPMNTVRNTKTFDFGPEVEKAKGSSPRNKSRADYLLSRDPMMEFFELTCKSIILNSPHMNAICTVNPKELYKRANEKAVPFFKWQKWIEETINKEVMRVVLRGGSKKGKKAKKPEKKNMDAAQKA